MLIKAGLACSRKIGRLSHAGERYELHTVAPGLLADHFHELETVRRRHVQIDESHVGGPLLRRLECGCTLEAAADRVPVAFQQGSETPGGVRIVIHDEYAAARP